MLIEDAIQVAITLLGGDHLRTIHEIILRESWMGKSYGEMASDYSYDPDYVKDAGSKLWQLLSQAVGKKVTKQNFQLVLKQQWETLTEEKVAQINLEKTPITSPAMISVAINPNSQQTWADAIDTSRFYGRFEELSTLKQWVVTERCRLVAVLGMGGMGKSTLAVKLAEQVQDQFDYLIWRSLRNAPLPTVVIAELINSLSHQSLTTHLTDSLDELIATLLKHLRQHRCLLILDNLESILESGQSVGHYRSGYQGYDQLLDAVATTQHQSSLVITSREKPKVMISQEAKHSSARSLQLSGLSQTAAQSLLQDKDLFVLDSQREKLITLYRGNPLALQIAANFIQELFNGDIEEFFRAETSVFNGIYELLNEQLNRLSHLEQQLMYWLTISCEPVSYLQLQEKLVPYISTPKLLEALQSLIWRCLIEKSSTGFSQQPVVMDLIRERFLEQAYQEILNEKLSDLKQYALVEAEARDKIRHSQNRILLQPLLKRLQAEIRSETEIITKLERILANLKEEVGTTGYGERNLIALLQQLNPSQFNYNHQSKSYSNGN